MADTALFEFDNTYARMPGRFFSKLPPTPVAEARLLLLNENLARDLGLDPDVLSGEIGVSTFAGNYVPCGAEPLAMAYAGHQFGNWVPQLGDGRAILLGEVVGCDGFHWDIQLKGAGPTPFSRMGDGRAALGPVLREFLISEAMHALGIPTTRSLAVVTTGEPVFRERPLPGAVLTRVARSHVRVGTFQFFAARQDSEALRVLADHVIDRLVPEAREADNPYLALLEGVVERQSKLIASWLLVSFIHGVMNTDNMSVSGETIDYGPCAFMDWFDPATVYSSIDRGGRYSYGNQPAIGMWNLSRFAQTLLPLLDNDPKMALAMAQQVIEGYSDRYRDAFAKGLARKLGLAGGRDKDAQLGHNLLGLMADNRADFTRTFRGLSDLSGRIEFVTEDRSVRDLFDDPTAFDSWAEQWRAGLAKQGLNDEERQAAMRLVNPAYIPRNHLVERALDSAENQGDLAPCLELLEVLRCPYEIRDGLDRYAKPPRDDEIVQATYCGT
ncbi:MAG: hypothetical protein CMM47_10485 [Rhodospirillaceae bacterium]|nr:hypothetical protein [Rhodospirillaceae bacterium]